jgi:hypothetical protein
LTHARETLEHELADVGDNGGLAGVEAVGAEQNEQAAEGVIDVRRRTPPSGFQKVT